MVVKRRDVQKKNMMVTKANAYGELRRSENDRGRGRGGLGDGKQKF